MIAPALSGIAVAAKTREIPRGQDLAKAVEPVVPLHAGDGDPLLSEDAAEAPLWRIFGRKLVGVRHHHGRSALSAPSVPKFEQLSRNAGMSVQAPCLPLVEGQMGVEEPKLCASAGSRLDPELTP